MRLSSVLSHRFSVFLFSYRKNNHYCCNVSEGDRGTNKVLEPQKTKMGMEGKKNWIIIGISGVTNGGKTTLANELSKMLGTDKILHQDTYFFPEGTPSHVKVDGLDHNNYDILSALDMKKMYDDILSYIAQKPGRGKNVMIVEGFTVLNYKPIEDLCDLKYYIVLEKEVCLRRRLTRSYDPPDVPGYFDICVWPEYLKYKKEIDTMPAIKLLDGTKNVEEHLSLILCDLNKSK